MMAKLNKNITVASALAGMCTIVLGLIMLFVFPIKADLTAGFRTPIVAFEFAKTEADLSYLTGNNPVEKTNREKMDAGHNWDMAFPFAYGGFLILLLLQLAIKGQRFVWLGLPFAVLIIPFDINENLILLGITEALSNSESVTGFLIQLQTATWLKWGAIGVAIAALSVGLIISKEYWSAAVSAVAAISVAVCRISDSKPSITEIMSIAIFLFFLFFSIKAGVQAWKVMRQNVG